MSLRKSRCCTWKYITRRSLTPKYSRDTTRASITLRRKTTSNRMNQSFLLTMTSSQLTDVQSTSHRRHLSLQHFVNMVSIRCEIKGSRTASVKVSPLDRLARVLSDIASNFNSKPYHHSRKQTLVSVHSRDTTTTSMMGFASHNQFWMRRRSPPCISTALVQQKGLAWPRARFWRLSLERKSTTQNYPMPRPKLAMTGITLRLRSLNLQEMLHGRWLFQVSLPQRET